jgi:uncharacterized membrane protein
MDAEIILGLVARWLHILAAITAVGGTIFARCVVVPTLDELPADSRAALHAALRRRWSGIVAVAIGFLILSGLYNIGIASVHFQLPRWYMPLFVVKFLLAFGIFAIASLLAGTTPAAEQMRRRLRLWLNLNIALAVAVVGISGVLRLAEKVPKSVGDPVPARGQMLRPAERFAARASLD